ncbi:hypothetical protein EDB81DRAFT_189651 [Dactylonectria macrodidyma]|uniref:Transmembrane protein n=1 Tax=Dactylonectria macrodidyma TaxID=307937 RepID=A0A9P9JPW1_9HYPO|nr:hypothetical protein EDB81DRAFT_189651 [Dactylonectria macrodidyma]
MRSHYSVRVSGVVLSPSGGPSRPFWRPFFFMPATFTLDGLRMRRKVHAQAACQRQNAKRQHPASRHFLPARFLPPLPPQSHSLSILWLARGLDVFLCTPVLFVCLLPSAPFLIFVYSPSGFRSIDSIRCPPRSTFTSLTPPPSLFFLLGHLCFDTLHHSRSRFIAS